MPRASPVSLAWNWPISVSGESPRNSRLDALWGKSWGMFKLIRRYFPDRSKACSIHCGPNAKSMRSPWRTKKNLSKPCCWSDLCGEFSNFFLITALSEKNKLLFPFELRLFSLKNALLLFGFSTAETVRFCGDGWLCCGKCLLDVELVMTLALLVVGLVTNKCDLCAFHVSDSTLRSTFLAGK